MSPLVIKHNCSCSIASGNAIPLLVVFDRKKLKDKWGGTTYGLSESGWMESCSNYSLNTTSQPMLHTIPSSYSLMDTPPTLAHNLSEELLRKVCCSVYHLTPLIKLSHLTRGTMGLKSGGTYTVDKSLKIQTRL